MQQTECRLAVAGLFLVFSGCTESAPKAILFHPGKTVATSARPSIPSFHLTAAGEPNFQLPNVAYWAEAGGGHFDNHGARDPSAPNMLLNQWSSNAPKEQPLQPETRKALTDDSALAIDLHNVRLTPELQTTLSKLRRLEWLNVSLGIDASNLAWLRPIQSLRGLSLTHADLNTADFRVLGEIKTLQCLDLSWSHFSGSTFANLSSLPMLETLSLSGLRDGDIVLQHLAQLDLRKLRSLTLEACTLTDAGIAALCDAYDLEYLNLYNSNGVTPRSIDPLCRMHKLHILGVGGTGIALRYEQTGPVLELQRRLPKCSIDYGD